MLKVHANPYGITDYPTPAAWPKVSLQQHWKGTGPIRNPDGPLVPGISHTHIEGKFPIWAELGAGPITVPFTLLLFNTTGVISDVLGQFAGPNGFVSFTECVVDQPLPMRGVPGGVVTLSGYVTFDPAMATATITKHGWFNTRIFARTHYDDTDQVDLEAWIPYYSILDPSLPETPTNAEGTMSFVAKASIAGPNVENGGFGLQLTEFRGTEGIESGFVPILEPFNTPQTVHPLGYNYKALPDSFKQHYELRLDPDFHMGMEGTVIDSTEIQLANGQKTGFNVAVLDPVAIAASAAPMGVTAEKHRLAFMWWVDTLDGAGGYKPNQRLVTLVAVEVEIGNNPVPPTGITVPSVIGATQIAATSRLIAAGLMLGTVTLASDQHIPAGAVASQFPLAGAIVVRGSTVNLTLSTGSVPVNTEIWVPTVPTFMQLQINGVPQPRWQICGVEENTIMDNCVEIVTKIE